MVNTPSLNILIEKGVRDFDHEKTYPQLMMFFYRRTYIWYHEAAQPTGNTKLTTKVTN